MKRFRRVIALFLTAVLLVSVLPGAAYGEGDAASDGYSTTILFTHDMHAHFLPTKDANGAETGGFARLATLLQQQREKHPDALTLDAGDFSMGSLFQSIYASDAPELRIMGALGYDATTFGNHEYDFRETGLASMLEAAVSSGEALPAILEANYFPPAPGEEDYDEDDALVWQAFADYGVEDYMLLERGGVTYGIFGINGEESAADAPESGMILESPAEAAQRMVEEIQAAADPSQPLFIICLSHSGTNENPKESEDEILASEVDGIDVIVSGHSHTVLEEPIQVNDTLIVSCGCYTANLGVLTVSWSESGEKTVEEYELIPVNGSVEPDAEIAGQIEGFKQQVVEHYLAAFGYSDFDQVIGSNSVTFDTVDDVYAQHRESGLGDLIADSYLYAVEQAEGPGGEPVTLALTATGVIRDSFALGDITVSDVFNVSSLGVGTDGLAGYPLVSAYLTGKEIKAVCEVDASVTPLMPAAQLHIAGVNFTWNGHRMIFNKVSSVRIVHQDGTLEDLEDDRLYRVVTGLYCAQMLSAVKSASFGLLSITPKYADGTEITNFDDCILYDAQGNEIKEWYALASYIQSFDGGAIPSDYSAENAVCRKVQSDSWNPIALMKNPNRLTVAVICVVLVLLLLIYLLIRSLVRRILYGTYGKMETRSKPYSEFGGMRRKAKTPGAVARHSRPIASSRRYGKGYQPEKAPKRRRKKVSKRKYGKFEYTPPEQDEELDTYEDK